MGGSDAKRRRELLAEARRKLGRGKSLVGEEVPDGALPAVHPRYRFSYRSLYPDAYKAEDEMVRSAWFVRCIAALALFLCFIYCDQNAVSFHGVDTALLQTQIEDGFGWDAVRAAVRKIEDDF